VNYPARPPQAPPPIFVEIDNAMRAGQLSRAVELARRALDAGHRDPVLYNLRAHGKKQAGLMEEALADLRQARALEPHSPRILGEMADCLNNLGRYNQALAAATDALAIEAALAPAWFHKGFAHQMLNELEQARAAYLEAVRLDPGMADGHARLAALASLAGAHDEVRKHATRAEAARPGHPIAAIALAATDLAEGRLDSAEPRLTALLRDPGAAPLTRAIALSHLGDLRDAQGRTHEAFEAYCRSGAIWKAAYEGRAS
jgi:tetratricopeptide (TPR) repeat protein